MVSEVLGRPKVDQTHHFALIETDARAWFQKTYPNATIITVRRGTMFNKAEFKKAQDKLKY